jgi:hypothetical protein
MLIRIAPSLILIPLHARKAKENLMNEKRTKVTPACATCETFGVSYHGEGADSR